VTDHEEWALESYRIADAAYRNVTAANNTVSDEFAQMLWENFIQRRIALAGYRMADIIYDLFGELAHAEHSPKMVEKLIKKAMDSK